MMDGYDPYGVQQQQQQQQPYGYPPQPQPPPLPLLPPLHHHHHHQPVASTSQLPPQPVPTVAGDWTSHLPLDTVQLPPGGSILVPAAGAGLGALPEQLAGGTQLVKVTAKSCSNCRTRKVKCDRRYPECTRCIKRKELCDYGDDVSIALRPTWVIPTEDDGHTSPPSGSVAPGPGSGPHDSLAGPAPASRAMYTPAALPYPLRPPPGYDPYQGVRALSDMQHHQALVRQRGGGGGVGGAGTAAGLGALRRVGDGTHAGAGARMMGDHDREEEGERGIADLWENFLRASNLGQSSSDWRLALPTMASSLQIHLIDASMHSCCFHLPAFHLFNPDIQYFKENIDQLDLASQVIVGILTSLGARASPHSALLGIAGPDIENGRASLDLVLSAGVRRENAWRAIVKRATDLCSKMDILQVPSARNLQTIVAFVQMLMLAEVQPKTARFFLRTAMGLYRDMQHGGLPFEEVQATKLSVGPTLFESDARIAAYLSMPVCISDEDLYEYFDGTGVHVPDLANEDLGPLLDDILDPSRGPITRDKLDRALGLTGYFVCAVQRAFANVSSSRRPNTRFLTTIPELWSYIDRAHAAVQRLHRRLVQLDYTPAGCDAHHSVDYDLLIGVRMDERLLDVVHLAHVWLGHQRRLDLTVDDRQALEDLLATSERRVRKCLKLLAFYSKVFVDSLDKHCVYHLVTQLEVLPGWATMVAQRENEPTDFGPLPAECALTDVELDWFTRALELACFFTPLANERLRELTAARAARKVHEPAPYAAFGDYDLSAPPAAPSMYQQQRSQHGVPSFLQQHQQQQQPTAQNNERGPLPFPPQQQPQNGPPRPPSPSWTFDSYGTPLAFVSGPSVGDPRSSDTPSSGPLADSSAPNGSPVSGGGAAGLPYRANRSGLAHVVEGGSSPKTGTASVPGTGTATASGTAESSPTALAVQLPQPAVHSGASSMSQSQAEPPYGGLSHGLPPTPARTGTTSPEAHGVPPPSATNDQPWLGAGSHAAPGAYAHATLLDGNDAAGNDGSREPFAGGPRITELVDDEAGAAFASAASNGMPLPPLQGVPPLGSVQQQPAWSMYGGAGADGGAGGDGGPGTW